MAKSSPSRSLNGREARADQIFPFSTLVTRVPQPAELSVAAAAGIVFTISGHFPQTATVHEPNASPTQFAERLCAHPSAIDFLGPHGMNQSGLGTISGEDKKQEDKNENGRPDHPFPFFLLVAPPASPRSISATCCAQPGNSKRIM
jgi:hypothetical protein